MTEETPTPFALRGRFDRDTAQQWSAVLDFLVEDYHTDIMPCATIPGAPTTEPNLYVVRVFENGEVPHLPCLILAHRGEVRAFVQDAIYAQMQEEDA